MGFRFRRRIGIFKGFSINFNKNSVGFSIGTKGAHYTINSKGRETISVGIPGTGLSYVETTNKSKKQNGSTNLSGWHKELKKINQEKNKAK